MKEYWRWFKDRVYLASEKRHERVIMFLQNHARPLICGVLMLYLVRRSVLMDWSDTLALMWSVWGLYTLYVALTLWWRCRLKSAYAHQWARILRYTIDCAFALALVYLGNGVQSRAFILLLLPVSLASYRFSWTLSVGLLLLLVAVYTICCLGAAARFETQRWIGNVLILCFVGYATGYSRMFLLNRVVSLSESVRQGFGAKRGPLDLKQVAQTIREGIGCEVCLLFREEKGRDYTLFAGSAVSQAGCEPLLPMKLPSGLAQEIEKDEVLCMNRKNALVRMPEDFRKAVACFGIGEGSPLRYLYSAIAAYMEAPEGTKVIVLLINSLRAPFFGAPAARVQRFKDEEDGKFLLLCAREYLMRAWWQAAEGNMRFIHETGVTDQICIMDSERRILFLNKARREFFGLREGVAEHELCHKVFHGYNRPNEGPPCDDCLFDEVLRSGGPAVWRAEYPHPRLEYLCALLASQLRTTDYLNRHLIVETVREVSVPSRQTVLYNFLVCMLQRQRDPDAAADFKKVCGKILQLFRDLKWVRARLYRWEGEEPQGFVCLGSIGHNHEITIEEGFRVKVHPNGEHDHISLRWMRDSPLEPTPILTYAPPRREDDADLLEAIARMQEKGLVKIYGVRQYPYARRLDKQHVTQTLDFPLIIANNLVGKVSVDLYNEDERAEQCAFGFPDIVIARQCAVVLGYLLESSCR